MQIHFTLIENRETDTTESFFSEHFLRARIDNNKPSNKEYDPIFEEGRSKTWIQSHKKEIKQNDLEYEGFRSIRFPVLNQSEVNLHENLLVQSTNQALTGLHKIK